MELYKKLAALSFVVTSTLLTGMVSHPVIVHAQATSSGGPGDFGTFEVGLPGDTKFQKNASIETFIKSFQDTPILSLVRLFVQFIIGIIVIIGVISMVVGGYFYMTAGGNAHQVEQAKEMIYSSLIGIFIAFISVVILNTINPFLGSKAVEPKLASPSASADAIINEPGSTNGAGGSSSNNSSSSGSSANNTALTSANQQNQQQLSQDQTQQAQYKTQIDNLTAISQTRPLTQQEQSDLANAQFEYNYYTEQINALNGAINGN